MILLNAIEEGNLGVVFFPNKIYGHGGRKKYLWFPLHVPEKVGTAEGEFFSYLFLFVYLTTFFTTGTNKFPNNFLTTFFFDRFLAFTSNIQQSTTASGRSHGEDHKNF
jgi:hypothetical protein